MKRVDSRNKNAKVTNLTPVEEIKAPNTSAFLQDFDEVIDESEGAVNQEINSEERDD